MSASLCVPIGVKIFVLHPDSVLKLALGVLDCLSNVALIVCPKPSDDKSVFEESCRCSAELCIFSVNVLCGKCGKQKTPENTFNSDVCTTES